MIERRDITWFSHLLRHPGKKMDQVYSFNPVARTGLLWLHLFVCSVFNGTFSISRLYRAISV